MSRSTTHSELFEMIPGGAASSSGQTPDLYRNHRPLVAHRPASDPEQCGYVWCNPKMKVIGELLEKVASWNVPVVLRGESGVGKEVLAREIHRLSPRSAKAFVKINCAALPSDLLESELFGYERGAVTRANKTKPRNFEIADGGAIIIDDIGEMDHPLQAKLLQVLQDGEVHHLGGTDPIRVDSRILVATHRNLEQAIERGTFREDLYYRLHVVDIWVPPLRQRRDEILPLARWFLQKHHRHDVEMPLMPAELEALMLSYPWPGNVRELENIMRKLLVFADPCGLADELQRKTAWQNRSRSAPSAPAVSKLKTGQPPQPSVARNTEPVSIDTDSNDGDPVCISKLLTALSSYGAPVSPERPFGFSWEQDASVREPAVMETGQARASNAWKTQDDHAAANPSSAGSCSYRPVGDGQEISADRDSVGNFSLPGANLAIPGRFLNNVQIASSTVAGIYGSPQHVSLPPQARVPAEPLDAPPADPRSQNLATLDEVDEERNRVERQAILVALRQSGWNRKRAAKLLKADYKALLYRMKKLNIDEADEGDL